MEKNNIKNVREKSVSNFQNTRKRYYNRKRNSKFHGKKNDQQTLAFKKVSLLIPLYNEEESIKPLYNEIKKSLSKINIDTEIFFIDDGSSDSSLKIIKELAKTDKKMKYVSFRKNCGKSAAINVGFKRVTGDAIITMDADLQDDPAEISNLLKKLNEDWDLVSGWKRKRYDPFIKKHSSKFFNYTTRLLSGIKLHDFNCGLKAYRKEVVKNVRVYGELHRYIPVLAAWKGFKVTEIAVKHHPRRYGKTKFGISRFFKGFIDLITVIFTTRYTNRPLHFFGTLGAFSFLCGFIVNGYLTVKWFTDAISLSNRPLLFLGMLLIIVGVQLFSVGLIGELFVKNSEASDENNIKEESRTSK